MSDTDVHIRLRESHRPPTAIAAAPLILQPDARRTLQLLPVRREDRSQRGVRARRARSTDPVGALSVSQVSAGVAVRNWLDVAGTRLGERSRMTPEFRSTIGS